MTTPNRPFVSPAASPFGDAVASLSLAEAAAWLALERSARLNAPVSTSFGLTIGLLWSVKERGILRLHFDGRTAAVKRSIYDPLSWTVEVPAPQSIELEQALLDRIRAVAKAPGGDEQRNALWRALASAEAQSYLSAQLRKHGFNGEWSLPLLEALENEWQGTPVARRRYLIWAAVRHGASIFLQSGGDLTRSYFAIQDELRRRGRWLAASETAAKPGDGLFLPYPSWTRPLLLEIYLSEFCDAPETYWTAAIPSDVKASS